MMMSQFQMDIHELYLRGTVRVYCEGLSMLAWRQTSVTQTVIALSELNPMCSLLLGTTDVESFSLLPSTHFQKGMSRASYLLSELNIAS